MTKTRGIFATTAAISIAALALSSVGANAAGAGYGDVSDAIVYGPAGPIGAPLVDLAGEDDESTTVAAPFPINFFGTKYEGLCITTNGSVYPVLTSTTSCSDSYDADLENLAIDGSAPIIAVLALDLDPSETLWVPGVAITSVSVTSGIARITTATPHPFIVGDDAYTWFSPDDPSFAGEDNFTVMTVPSPTTFTFVRAIADEATRAVTGATASIGDYDDARDDTNSDGYADDGFGAVRQVYFGTTTIDGKQALVATWYRVPTNDGNNSPLLSNTVQIVLIQEPTTNGATAGYDFTIQLNVGTATDNDDGYSAADPSDSCDSGDVPDDCRWGMGWADYDPDTDTAVPFELFAAFPINQLVDSGGTTALVNNRLNTSVLGRYTWGMVGGVTVGFATPRMDGTDNGTLAARVTPAALPSTGIETGVIGGAAAALLVLGAATLILVRRRQSLGRSGTSD